MCSPSGPNAHFSHLFEKQPLMCVVHLMICVFLSRDSGSDKPTCFAMPELNGSFMIRVRGSRVHLPAEG